jgi:putative tryptophan/tyrosine transport system substrate-binding protein
MRRREFIRILGGSVVAWPFAARAQARLPMVGVLALGNPPVEPLVKGLRDALRAIGYSEDRIRLEVRTAEGSAGRLPELANELVRLKADVIVAYQTPAATAAKQATRDIPIVMAGVGDAVGTGLVASLARPEGNVTGSTVGAVETAGKLVELVHEIIPLAKRFAVLANETDPFTAPFLAENGRVGRNIGLEMEVVLVRPGDPLEAAFQKMTDKRVDAVVIQGSLVSKDAIELAKRHGVPSLSANSTVPRSGGLMSYSASASFRETAGYVDKLLRGAKPGDLPVTFPSKFNLILNLQAAKALGLTISPMILARADEVIE